MHERQSMTSNQQSLAGTWTFLTDLEVKYEKNEKKRRGENEKSDVVEDKEVCKKQIRVRSSKNVRIRSGSNP